MIQVYCGTSQINITSFDYYHGLINIMNRVDSVELLNFGIIKCTDRKINMTGICLFLCYTFESTLPI